jgi:hypothetical protein
MKINEDQINRCYDRLIEELQLYTEMGTIPIRKLSGALQSLRSALAQVKQLVLAEGFAGEAEEIAFFKQVKPKFVSEQLYFVEVCSIQQFKPFEAALLADYYSDELRRVRVFLSRHSFLYQCFQMGASELDSVLFLRNAGTSGMLLPVSPDPDPLFSTNGDFLWAKFMAYERLSEWLGDELNSLRPGGGPQAPAGGNGGLKWTGDGINLVELGYGIWLTGQLNNGNAGIAEIVAWLEVCFGVKLGRPYRRWQSIAGRKRVGVTKYADEIRVAILKRLDEELGR